MNEINLLIINFEMDLGSPVLAWQAKVAAELGGRFRRVDVLTHRMGDFQLPPNVHVHQFPRWPQRRFIRSLGGWFIINLWAAYCLRHSMPRVCFIHMNMQLAFRLHHFLRRYRIPILMWYAHGTVTRDLEKALACVDRVVTSTPEGFRIPSNKVHIIGQAIDTELFHLLPPEGARHDLIYVGRISERKRIGLIIDCFASLVRIDPSTPFRLRLIGPTLTAADKQYETAMRSNVESLGLSSRVEFVGAVRLGELPAYYESAFAHLNLSETGSMDKTVMEALSCGCPVLTTGEAFREALSPLPGLMLDSDDPDFVALRLLEIHRQPDLVPRAILRNLVVGKHDLSHYLEQLTHHLSDLCSEGEK